MNRNPHVYARPFSADPDGALSDAYPAQEGLTLRDQAALKAFAAIAGGYWSHPDNDIANPAQKFARLAFEYADAFMAERNRPYDEQQAAWAAERERIAKARYLIGTGWRLPIDEGNGEETVLELRWVFDRTECRIVALDQRNGDEWEPPGAGVLALCESQLKRSSVLDDLDADDIEATDELPDWAK